MRRGSVEHEGRTLVESLGGRWGPNGGMCRCPAHDDRTPSLSVRPGRTRLLFHCFAGCDASLILRALDTGGHLEARAPRAASPGTTGGGHTAVALRLWNEARAVAGTPAAAYLAGRGLAANPVALRYHPNAPYGPRPCTRHVPALIAAVRDQSGIVAVHRTFIDPAGRGLAALAQPRRGLGAFGRGAVRLGGSAVTLGLAEGIETAMSATALFGVPCWATLGTERFALVALPSEVRQLLLFLDHDSGGRRAEALARKAFEHIGRIESHYPPKPGADWNDVLRRFQA